MIELTEQEISRVSGGIAPVAGAIAVGVIFWYEFGGGREYFERRAT